MAARPAATAPTPICWTAAALPETWTGVVVVGVGVTLTELVPTTIGTLEAGGTTV